MGGHISQGGGGRGSYREDTRAFSQLIVGVCI